jgi:hypothetical protein
MAKQTSILTASMKRKINGLGKFELKTDYLGRSSNKKTCIQIKLWLRENGNVILLGIITFDKNILDFDFKGLLKQSNSKSLLDLWFYTGSNEYYLDKDNLTNKWFLQFSLIKQFGHPEIHERYKNLTKVFPEYKDMTIIL